MVVQLIASPYQSRPGSRNHSGIPGSIFFTRNVGSCSPSLIISRNLCWYSLILPLLLFLSGELLGKEVAKESAKVGIFQVFATFCNLLESCPCPKKQKQKNPSYFCIVCNTFVISSKYSLCQILSFRKGAHRLLLNLIFKCVFAFVFHNLFSIICYQ